MIIVIGILGYKVYYDGVKIPGLQEECKQTCYNKNWSYYRHYNLELGEVPICECLEYEVMNSKPTGIPPKPIIHDKPDMMLI